VSFEARKATAILGRASTVRDRIRAQANLRRLLEDLAAASVTRPSLCRYVSVALAPGGGVDVTSWFGKLDAPGFGWGGGIRFLAVPPYESADVRIPQLDHPPTRIIDLLIPRRHSAGWAELRSQGGDTGSNP
jgi:hypothetical protein